MNYKTVISNGCIINDFSGEWDPYYAKSCFSSIKKTSDDNNLAPVILDWSNVFPPEIDFYRHLIGEYIAEIFGYKHKVAMILKGADTNEVYIESTVLNRGCPNFKIFNTEASAYAWIKNLTYDPEQLIDYSNYKIPQWSKDFEIGIPKIDLQHHNFLELIREAYSLSKESKNPEKYTEFFDEIILYARFHFRSEEKVMDNIGYPKLEIHRQSHINIHNELTVAIDALSKNKITIEGLIEFLIRWFVNHIGKEDLEIGKFYNKHD